MTDEMIEAVARAIVLADGLNPLERLEAGDETLFRWEINQPRARAAIAAHKSALAKAGLGIRPRKPTEAMLDTATKNKQLLARAFWQAMWDEYDKPK